jgi:hypothetical protein
MKSSSVIWSWVWVALLAVFALWQGTVAAQEPDGTTWPRDLLIGGGVVVIVFGSVNTANWIRRRALLRGSPSAFVRDVNLYPQALDQLVPLARKAGVMFEQPMSLWYRSIVIDDSSFRIVGGVFNRRELLSVPIAQLKAARIAVSPQGRYNLSSLELEFGFDGSDSRVDLALIQTRFGLPRVQGRVQLERDLGVIETILTGSRTRQLP